MFGSDYEKTNYSYFDGFSLYCGVQFGPRDFLEVKEFGGKGKIVAIDIEKGSATIDHEKIEGLMSAMTMSCKAQDKKILDGLGTGDIS